MWISTLTRLPVDGQRVFSATSRIIYRSRFRPDQIRPSDDGPLWFSLSGFRVTHWMPAELFPDGVPPPPPAGW